MRAVKIAERILMIVQLELWDETKAYDRLGVDNPQMDILGIPIPCVTVPVKPGRNLSVIIEAATIRATITPSEIAALKLAIPAAMELGYGREVVEENDEIDLGLAELNAQKKTT